MNRDFIFKNKRVLVAAFLVICMVAAFWIRVIPAASFSYPDYLGGAEPDIWYNLRQIEVMVHHFPQYNWFDPMTAFPAGKTVDWGPLFPCTAAILAILSGAATRPDLMAATSYMGPIVAVALVPVVFLLGKHIWDSWAGLIAALFITVGTFALYYRTTYGYIDHHGMETLLSTVFVLSYLCALYYAKAHPPSGSDIHTYVRPALIAALAGVAFALGLMNMPTMILFALVVAIFTVAAFILHAITRTSSDYLLIVNVITFLVVLIALPLIGMNMESLALSQYSPGQFLCYLFLIVGTFVLWFLGKVTKNVMTYLVAIVLVLVAMVALLNFSGSTLIADALSLFFGQESDVATIQEMQGYEVRFAILSYNYGIVLAAGGFIALLWKTWTSKDFRLVFLAIWSLVMAIATLQHRRFEYYFAVNFALLSGIAVSWIISTTGREVLSHVEKTREYLFPAGEGKPEGLPEKQVRTGKKPQKKARAKMESTREKKGHRQKITLPVIAKTILFGIVLLLVALFVVYSVNNDLTYASNPKPYMTEADWVETLLWLKETTPEPGVDYFGTYDKATFTYPNEAYGVMAWWDYGHYITFIAGRIPNTNPFQDNLEGSTGAAAFYIAQDETTAEKILSRARSRFILTDTRIVSQKFHAIAEWHNSTAGIHPYRKWLYFPDRERIDLLKAIAFNTPEYYRTMVARLHLNDGSATDPTTAYYMEYQEQSGYLYPVITSSEEIEVTAGMQKADTFNSHALPGTGAAVLSSQVMYPLEDLPALRHFRLVHESTGDSRNVYAEGSDPRLRATPLIKVFEYVKGARIEGDGTIEVGIVSNTGREFTYRQKSVNGSFIVPYTTSGNTWEVRTKGNYRIVETGKEIAVSEDDVTKGRMVG